MTYRADIVEVFRLIYAMLAIRLANGKCAIIQSKQYDYHKFFTAVNTGVSAIPLCNRF